MKKQSTSRLGRVFRRIINIRSWMDWERVKSFTLYLLSVIKKLFVLQKPQTRENFLAAKKRLNLTDNDLLARQKGLLRLTIVMLTCASLLCAYAFYLLVHGSYKGFIVGIVVMCISLVLAFRYHFWYFQIKHQKLGCTFHQWLKQGLMGGKK